MKIKIFNIIFLILIFQSLAISQNHWQYVNDNPPYLKVYSADVIENTAYFWCTDNIVYKTSDAGESFEILLPYAPTDNTELGCCDKHGIAFADSNIGYIADVAHGEFRTTDGGNTWQKTENVGSNISLVEFGSVNVGWKIGDGGLYKTTNSGETWSYISFSSLFNGGVFSNIYALDENKVWILKSYYSGRNIEGSIWQSSDGGNSWHKQGTDLVSSDENQIVYNDIKILQSGIGIAIGEINRPLLNEKEAFIQRTTDFGVTWTTTILPFKNLKKIINVNNSVWVIIGNNSPIAFENDGIVQLRSVDSGQSWSESNPFEYINYNFFYSAVYIPSFNSILVSTASGMYKSTDEGQTYFRITTELELYVKDVNFDRKPITSTKQTIIATSFNRSYLLSENSGDSWEKKEIPERLGFKICDAKISEGTIYIIVDQERLFKSTDYGETWIDLSIPAYSAILGLDVFDKNTLVVQSYRKLLTSLDGGETWFSTPFPGQFRSNASFMSSPDDIITAGAFYDSLSTKGFIYKTSDNGFNWQIKDTPNEMKQIKMISNNTGYACSEKNLYKTSDAGNTWTIIKSSNSSISAFCFRDTLNGLVHQGIYFYETKNGGNNWEKVDLKFPYEHIDKIEVNRNGNYFAVSNGNLLFSPYSGTENNQSFIDDAETKNGFILFQNYPNPFNPSTKIEFEIPKNSFVNLTVYNSLGQKVKVLINKNLTEGKHNVEFNAGDLSSGVYFYKLQSENFSKIRKMILLR